MTETTDTDGTDLTIQRAFDASPERVWEAWTNREQFAQWWAPEGFTTQVHEFDTQPGGSIRVDMIGPDDTVHPMVGEFEALSKPEQIVFVSSAKNEAGEVGLEVHNSVSFVETAEGTTELTLQAVVVTSTPEMADALDGMEDGWNQSLDKLAGVLDEQE